MMESGLGTLYFHLINKIQSQNDYSINIDLLNETYAATYKLKFRKFP